MLKNKKVLVSFLFHIGDFCVISPCCEYLKKNYSCSITVCIIDKTLPIASLCSSIDHLLILNDWIKLSPQGFLEKLKKEHFDIFIDLTDFSSDTSILGQTLNVLPFFAKEANIPVRIGDRNCSGLYTHASEKKPTSFIAGNFLNRLRLIGVDDELSFSELCALQNFTPPPPSPKMEKHIAKDKINLIIHPGSKHLVNWPKNFYLEIISLLKKEFNILITGTECEKKYFPIEINHPHLTDLRGKITLSQFILLISKSDALLSNSTGPSHLAAIFNSTPITLFTNEKLRNCWGPLSDKTIAIVAPKSCTSCDFFMSFANLSFCKCMSTISPKHVYKKIKSWERKIVKK